MKNLNNASEIEPAKLPACSAVQKISKYQSKMVKSTSVSVHDMKAAGDVYV
jgi:hypothetical protein